MKIALCEMDIKWEEKEENKKTVATFLMHCAAIGAKLVLFPEMTLTGFTMNAACAAEDNDKTRAFFIECAVKYKLALGYGSVSLGEDKKGRNNYSIISKSGKEIGYYCKLHPFSFGEESKHYSRGNELSISSLEDLTLSTFICYDLRFPEIFQAVSKNSELITVAANWPEVRREHWITLLRARAIENQCYIAGVNRIGRGDSIDYCGDSAVYSPNGELVSKLELSLKELGNIYTADIDASIARSVRDSFRLKDDRRVDFYISQYEKQLK